MIRHCWFARFSEQPCDWDWLGAMRCHTIKKSRIKDVLRSWGWNESRIDKAVWDERILVPGCARHHHQHDHHFLPLLESDYPAGTHEYAKDYGFVYQDARRGWVYAFGTENPELREAA